jgi:nucleoid DNA-binding protein
MSTTAQNYQSLLAKIQAGLPVQPATKKEAEAVLTLVTSSIINTLEENSDHLSTLRLKNFGKLTIKHRPAGPRKIPFTGLVQMTKAKRKVRFSSLGQLRKFEEMVPVTADTTPINAG